MSSPRKRIFSPVSLLSPIYFKIGMFYQYGRLGKQFSTFVAFYHLVRSFSRYIFRLFLLSSPSSQRSNECMSAALSSLPPSLSFLRRSLARVRADHRWLHDGRLKARTAAWQRSVLRPRPRVRSLYSSIAAERLIELKGRR